jgi:hypothetical protein
MSGRFRWSLIIATMVGLAAALWALGREGWSQVLASAVRTGPGGFALLCLVTIATFGLLGGAWLAAVPGEPVRRIGLFSWARAARDAANDLLPFSQLGALVVGARTLMAGGIDQTRIYAAMIVDLTTEMAAQLLFTLFALWAFGTALSGPHEAGRLLPILWAGLGVATAIMGAFLFLQRPALRFAAFLAARLLPQASELAEGVGAQLTLVYGQRWRVLVSFLFNLAAWAATAFWSWLALHLMGVEASLWRALRAAQCCLSHPRCARGAGGGLCLVGAFGGDRSGSGAGTVAGAARARCRGGGADLADLAGARDAGWTVPKPSFPRRRESINSELQRIWIPAFARMTV